jgi:hypothetical protein
MTPLKNMVPACSRFSAAELPQSITVGPQGYHTPTPSLPRDAKIEMAAKFAMSSTFLALGERDALFGQFRSFSSTCGFL